MQLCETHGCPKLGVVHHDVNGAYNIGMASVLTDILGVRHQCYCMRCHDLFSAGQAKLFVADIAFVLPCC